MGKGWTDSEYVEQIENLSPPGGAACMEDDVILLHRLNGAPFFLNHRHIETIESTPDTILTLTNEHKYLVREGPEQIRLLIEEYHRKIFKINLPESVDI
jgi:flagellar protein FlbD